MTSDAAHGDHTHPVAVHVVRSGGFAGVTRQWSAEPPAHETDEWTRLVESCPWSDPQTDDAGADRFHWRIEATVGDARRAVDLGEGGVTGPWRTLIDRVRVRAAESPPPASTT